MSVPSLGDIIIKRPFLVVQDIEYNRTVPVIIGTNIIRYYTYNRTSKDCLLNGRLLSIAW